MANSIFTPLHLISADKVKKVYFNRFSHKAHFTVDEIRTKALKWKRASTSPLQFKIQHYIHNEYARMLVRILDERSTAMWQPVHQPYLLNIVIDMDRHLSGSYYSCHYFMILCNVLVGVSPFTRNCFDILFPFTCFAYLGLIKITGKQNLGIKIWENSKSYESCHTR